ncbi:hypothetical protein [Streptomyces sp. NPDC047974]
MGGRPEPCHGGHRPGPGRLDALGEGVAGGIYVIGYRVVDI